MSPLNAKILKRKSFAIFSQIWAKHPNTGDFLSLSCIIFGKFQNTLIWIISFSTVHPFIRCFSPWFIKALFKVDSCLIESLSKASIFSPPQLASSLLDNFAEAQRVQVSARRVVINSTQASRMSIPKMGTEL